MKKMIEKRYLGFITELKQSIIKSRLQAARLANREQLLLYINVGAKISQKINTEKWGARVLQQIASDLQAELPGLRGFSETNLKKMRQFADEYAAFLIRPLPTVQLENKQKMLPVAQSKTAIRQLPTAQLKNSKKAIRPLPTAQLEKVETEEMLTAERLNYFFSISFTHHILLLNKCPKKEERLFYMQLAALQMMSVETMAQNIRSKTFRKKGRLPNNFTTALPAELKASALDVFKDEYLFDFMEMDDTGDERMFETALVSNIKKFILSLGRGFTFIGNQYRLELAGREYATDLLF